MLPALLGPGSRVGPAQLAALAAIGAPADGLLRFDSLLSHGGAAAARRLRASGEEVGRLVALYAAAHATRPLQPAIAQGGPEDAELRRLLAVQKPAPLILAAWQVQAVARAWGWDGPDDAAWAAWRRRLAETPVPVFPLQGRDALALGAAPGPAVGRLLEAVRGWWLDGGCAAGRDECLARLSGLMKDIHAKPLPEA